MLTILAGQNYTLITSVARNDDGRNHLSSQPSAYFILKGGIPAVKANGTSGRSGTKVPLVRPP